MPIPIYQVDAFTSTPFKGNPAGVCLLREPADEEWMRNVAAEMNLAETAFLIAEGPNRYSIRWLTPTSEVDLCGHATLASAHLLYEIGEADPNTPIRFSSRSGELIAVRKSDFIMLDFPSTPPAKLVTIPDALRSSTNCELLYAGKNTFDYLVELSDEATVRDLKPNLDEIRTLGARGLVVTAIADSGNDYDFVSRGFFPAAGIDEDSVTGSAHCMLGPYWMPKLGRSEMTGYQASKRGGSVKLRVDGDRVKLCGNAITTIIGALHH